MISLIVSGYIDMKVPAGHFAQYGRSFVDRMDNARAGNGQRRGSSAGCGSESRGGGPGRRW